MKSKIFTYLTLLALISLYSCKESHVENQNKDDLNRQITSDTLPADFMEFYTRFGRDSSFQIQHIVFPLDGEKAKDDGNNLSIHLMKWNKEDWLIQHEYSDMGGSFQRRFIEFHGIVTETIQDQSGIYSMVRRWSKIDGEWMLIFYKEMGQH